MDKEELERKVRRIESEARAHKRAVRQHRLALRKHMQELVSLRTACAKLGIAFTLDATIPEPKSEGEPHGSNKDPTPRSQVRRRA